MNGRVVIVDSKLNRVHRGTTLKANLYAMSEKYLILNDVGKISILRADTLKPDRLTIPSSPGDQVTFDRDFRLIHVMSESGSHKYYVATQSGIKFLSKQKIRFGGLEWFQSRFATPTLLGLDSEGAKRIAQSHHFPLVTHIWRPLLASEPKRLPNGNGVLYATSVGRDIVILRLVRAGYLHAELYNENLVLKSRQAIYTKQPSILCAYRRYDSGGTSSWLLDGPGKLSILTLRNGKFEQSTRPFLYDSQREAYSFEWLDDLRLWRLSDDGVAIVDSGSFKVISSKSWWDLGVDWL